MKTKIFTLALALFFTAMLNAQNVPNGGFEAWTDGEPDEWTTSNVGPITTISQSIINHSGSYAVKGQTDTDETIVPILESGYDNSGFPVSEKYEQLSFWYQYVEQGSDMMLVTVTIADEDYSTLGHASLEIEDATEGYTLAILPIEYDGVGTPAVAIVSFSLYDATGGDPPDKETYFLIDDVELSTVTGIEDQVLGEKIRVFPNPTTDHFKISIPEDDNYNELEVINQLGQKMYSQKLSNTDKIISVDHNWEAGVYFIRLKSDDVSVTETLIIK